MLPLEDDADRLRQQDGVNADWAERQRRSRVLRVGMLFIMTLLLMDSGNVPIAKDADKSTPDKTDPDVLHDREQFASAVTRSLKSHPRFVAVEEYNERLANRTREIGLGGEEGGSSGGKSRNHDNSGMRHYPRNLTGMYWGDWSLVESADDAGGGDQGRFIVGGSVPVGTGVYLFPPGFDMQLSDMSGADFIPTEEDDKKGGSTHTDSEASPDSSSSRPSLSSLKKGPVQMRFAMKHLTGISEISLVRGLIRFYDGSYGVPSHEQFVSGTGIFVHKIGRVSMISDPDPKVGALIINNEQRHTSKDGGNHDGLRRLVSQREANLISDEDLISSAKNMILNFPELADSSGWEDFFSNSGPSENWFPDDRRLLDGHARSKGLWALPLSLFPIPRAAVVDPGDESEGIASSAKACKYEISLDVKTEYLSTSQYDEQELVAEQLKNSATSLRDTHVHETYVVQLDGKVFSRDCLREFNITAEAIRIDWDDATSRGMNYAIVATLVCLSQVAYLFRQILHSQASSSAAKISVLTLGCQALIDGHSAFFHLLISTYFSSLFVAFMGIVFLKVLLCLVLELKYMDTILKARYPALTSAQHQQQARTLHVTFYATAFLSVLALWIFQQAGCSYIFFLVMYSFWVPQIVLNVMTEARKPLHTHYILGMSISRILLPLYFMGYGGNFVSVALVDFKPSYGFSLFLVLWVGLQTAVLLLQVKLGTRWMIPAMFLPPKYDYSRPIPASMMPTTVLISRGGSEDRDIEACNNDVDDENTRLVRSRDPEDQSRGGVVPGEGSLDCVICYSTIDPRQRSKYMLAPCNHIFCRTCLEPWMEIKMQCPVCRTDLPPL